MALRHLAWPGSSCLALDLKEGPQPLPSQNQAKMPSLWLHLVLATGIFLLPKLPPLFAPDLSLSASQ